MLLHIRDNYSQLKNSQKRLYKGFKSYLSHRSTDIKIKKYKIINFVNFVNIRENCLYYNAIHNFSVWLGTGFNPADLNRFRSHTGKYF